MKKEYLYSYICYIISAFCVSLAIKANVGVSSFNSMNAAISDVSSIKIGTITIFFNTFFLLLYAKHTDFKYKIKYTVQFVSVMCFGFFINFFTYNVLGDLYVEDYALRLLMIVISTVLGASAIGVIVSLSRITFPIESLCDALSMSSNYSFRQLRYGIDIFSVTVSLLITSLFHVPLYVREGTIISLVLFSFVLSVSKGKIDKLKPA